MTLACEGISVAQRLHSLTATFRRGEVAAICGPNGAGKSTLLSCLAGLMPVASGAITLDGVPFSALTHRARARQIGFLPQSPEIAWDVSVEVLVSLGRLPWKGASGADRQDAIDSAIADMDLDSMRLRPLSRLSGGERARALMARVLATRPGWILADEPLANLDLAHAAALIARLREQAEEGRGVVLVLHDLATAMNHADRVLVLNDGALAADGPPQAALAEPVIANVWNVDARWIGENGARALAVTGQQAS